MNPPDNAPVLVAVAAVQQKQINLAKAKEPIALMIDAVNAALKDSQAPTIAKQIDHICVPKGMWQYTNPAALIAEAIGANNAVTEFCDFGILQQTNLGQACQKIAASDIEVALVVGGEAKYRQLQAMIQNVEVSETQQHDSQPDSFLQPEAELWSEIESKAGLGMPVGYYALIESAICHQQGISMDQHRDNIASHYARFSEIAASNPDGWAESALTAETIRNAGDKNAMLAFPYAKHHNSQWNVDQACALLFCSVSKAREYGIPESQWIFPLASTESNQIINVSQRPNLGQSKAAEMAGQRALNIAGLTIEEIDFIDLYSCFPSAVNLNIQALNIPEDRDLTVTGAMPYGGGPLNNYCLQATVKLAQLLRQKPGSYAIASCVSGMFTKQGYGIWSSAGYSNAFIFDDVSDELNEQQQALELIEPQAGTVEIVAATVLFEKNQAQKLVIISQYPEGQRSVSYSVNADHIAQSLASNLVGKQAHINQLGLIDSLSPTE